MAKRDYKTVSEWKKAYRDKAKLMNERGYRELQPKEFYRAIFPEGSLQSREHDGKGNIIATQIRPSGKGRTKQWVIDDSLDMLDKVIGDSFGLIPPLSFYGKTHTKENAHQLFAMAIDIDYVGLQQLKNMLKQFGNGVQLCPTFLGQLRKGCSPVLSAERAGGTVCQPRENPFGTERGLYPQALERHKLYPTRQPRHYRGISRF